jgi:hypothetical protein
MLNARILSEVQRWWDHTLPLPMPSPPHIGRPPS